MVIGKYRKKKIKNEIREIVSNMKQMGIVINDRIGPDNDYSICDYRVYQDRFIPDKQLDIKWQHINTIGYSWGYNAQQEEKDYKSGEMIYELYNTVRNFGGGFLINIGPKSDGSICCYESSAIEYFAKKI